MELSVPILVSRDARDRYEVLVPRILGKTFAGVSLARLFDDVALHLMEQLPKEPVERVPLYELCPYVELRKVKAKVRILEEEADAEARPRHQEERPEVDVRTSVVVSRWPEEDYFIGTVPRLGPEQFAFPSFGELEACLITFLEARLRGRDEDSVVALACQDEERLEILTFDAELPSILPSEPRRKRKQDAADRAERQRGAPKKDQPPKKRKLIPPITLSEVGSNLMHRALDGRLAPAFGRDALVDAVVEELKRDHCAVLLVGPSGAGKTSIVYEAVRRLAAENLRLEERIDVWQVDGNRIIAGMSVVGAWEARVGAMVHELSERLDALYVNDLPALLFTGRSSHGDSNVAQYLEPHLARGELKIVGECTPERLAAVRDERPGFFERFRVLTVEELDARTTWRVLGIAARSLAETEGALVSLAALEVAQSLGERFFSGVPEPGRSLAILHDTVADRDLGRVSGDGRRQLQPAAVIGRFAAKSGLPLRVLSQNAARDPREVQSFFEHRIIGQPAAWEAAADVVTTLEQGLSDPTRPLATFLFVGPTGVGKTETAKALAEHLFGTAERLIRFDMSELSGPDALARLTGDRLRPEGELTRRVAQQPFSVVLLDEIEKAHPAVFDALLQVLGEGRLTNAAGHTVRFTSAVVVMTSNLGVREAQHQVGFGEADATAREHHFRDAAAKFFRPELYNRIDRVVAFDRLEREHMVPLVTRLLAQLLGRRGLVHRSVVVDVERALIDRLIEEAYDPRYGARAVKRTLERKLAVPLATQILGIERSRLVVVHAQAGDAEIQLSLEVPEERPILRGDDGEAARALDLGARHQRLRRWVLGFEGDPRRAELTAEEGLLTDLWNRGELDASGVARLEHLERALRGGTPETGNKASGAPAAQAPADLEDLVRRLDDLEVQFLSGRDVREQETVRSLSPRNPSRHSVLERAVSVQVRDLAAATAHPAALAELEALESAAARMSSAFESALAPPEPPALLVVRAVGSSASGNNALYDAITFYAEEAGLEVGPAWRLAEGWEPLVGFDPLSEDVPVFAVRVEGRALSEILGPLLGLHLGDWLGFEASLTAVELHPFGGPAEEALARALTPSRGSGGRSAPRAGRPLVAHWRSDEQLEESFSKLRAANAMGDPAAARAILAALRTARVLQRSGAVEEISA